MRPNRMKKKKNRVKILKKMYHQEYNQENKSRKKSRMGKRLGILGLLRQILVMKSIRATRNRNKLNQDTTNCHKDKILRIELKALKKPVKRVLPPLRKQRRKLNAKEDGKTIIKHLLLIIIESFYL